MPRLGSGFLEPAEQCGMTIEMQILGLIPGLQNQELSSRVGGGGLGTGRWFLCTRVWEELSWEKSILDGEFHKQHNSAIPGH